MIDVGLMDVAFEENKGNEDFAIQEGFGFMIKLCKQTNESELWPSSTKLRKLNQTRVDWQYLL